MMNHLARLKSLRAEIKAMQFQIETLKAIASSKQGEVLRPLIEADELHLAGLESELAKLTAEVTKTICSRLATQPTLLEVILAREVEGAKFDAIARRINRSSRWAHELHQRGLRQLTSAAR